MVRQQQESNLQPLDIGSYVLPASPQIALTPPPFSSYITMTFDLLIPFMFPPHPQSLHQE